MINEILALAKNLMAIPSTKDDDSRLKDVLTLARKNLSGFTVEVFQKNGSPSLLAYVGKTRPKRFKIILNGHLDVVPANEIQYKPFEKDGKLFGRGAYDMKAATAVLIVAFKELAKKISYPLGLQLVADEETGGFYGTKYQIEQGVRADFVIAGEPTDFEINNDAKGIIWAKLLAFGKSAHGAYPWLGENALGKLVSAISTIQTRYPTPTKEAWKTTVNLSWIKTTNTTINKVPDNAEAMLDIRYIPDDEQQIVKAIKRLLPKGVTMTVEVMEPAQYTSKTNPYLVTLQKVISEMLRRKMPIVVKHGGSDIRHYNKVGSSGVTFGPIGAGHHTEDEWVDIKSLEDYYTILIKYLEQLDKSSFSS